MTDKPKVTLIKPPIPYHLDQTQQQPLGIIYIASMARKYDYPVELVDLSNKKGDEWLEFIPESDIYGFTATFLDYKICEKIAQVLKRERGNCTTVIGGFAPTTSPEIINFDIFDSAIIGEGEISFLNLIRDYEKHSKKKRIYTSDLIEDLDNIPFPARDLYEVKGGRIFNFGKDYDGTGRSTGIITSRGCPFNCGFCANKKMWGDKVRYRSIDNIIGEIEETAKKYNIKQFRFQDDNLTLKRDRILRLCDKLTEFDFNIYWRLSTRTDKVDKELLQEMKKAGCVEIGYGIETGDQYILDLLEKGITVEQNIESIRIAQEAGLAVKIYFMVGLPGTTKDTHRKDIQFLERAELRPGIDAINPAIYTPYPGSPVWNSPEKYRVKILTKDFDRYNMHFYSAEKRPIESFISIKGLSQEELEASKKKVLEYAEKMNFIHKVIK